MKIVPLTLNQANDLIKEHHRHHKPVVGHRFTLGLEHGEKLIGAVVVGRPVSRELDQYRLAEVTRLVTNGEPNACSMLYGAAARVAKEMGFDAIQTYILITEPGTSLKASGWVMETTTAGGDWNYSWRKGRRTDQPMGQKQRWAKRFNTRTPAAGTSAGPQPERKHMNDETQPAVPETKSTTKRKAAQQAPQTLPLFPAAATPQGAPKVLTAKQKLLANLGPQRDEEKRTAKALKEATKALKGFLKEANAQHGQLIRAEARARKARDKAFAAVEKTRAKLNGAA